MPQKNYFARKILVAGDEAEAIRTFARKEISILLNECFFTIETIKNTNSLKIRETNKNDYPNISK